MSRQKLILFSAGILLMAFGAGNTWKDYLQTHNPLDSVPTSTAPAGGSPAAINIGGQPDEARLAGRIGLASGPDNSAGKKDSAPVSGLVPDRLVIQSIQLDAPIIPVSYRAVSFDDQMYNQWLAPNKFAVGWDDTSALLGLPGNSVFDGHHNAYGKVFENLVDVNLGDRIDMYSGSQVFHYQVVVKLLVPERYQPVATRLANARWIAPTSDERITLITCWPATSNTHRVIVVAYPLPSQ